MITIKKPSGMNNKLTIVELGEVSLYFSYETLVGITKYGVGTYARENVWGPTTGKHLNYFSKPEERIEKEEFDRIVADLLPLGVLA